MKVLSVEESGMPWYWLITLEDNSKFYLSQNRLLAEGPLNAGDDVTVELARVPVYSNVEIPFARKVTRLAKVPLTE